MIKVIGATRAVPSETITDMAQGRIDEYGNPFQVIELSWNRDKGAPYQKTHGFEDTVILKSGDRGKLEIKHTLPGTIWWDKSILGDFVGKIAKTPHNMHMLATHYEDKLWIIRDPLIRSEVEMASKEHWSKMEPEMQAFHKERIRKSNISRFDKGDNVMPVNLNRREEGIDQKEADLFKKENLLSDREKRLEMREAEMNNNLKAAIESGVRTTSYSQDYLNGLKVPQLRKLAKEQFTLSFPATAKKIEMIDAINEAQGKVLVAPNSDVVPVGGQSESVTG